MFKLTNKSAYGKLTDHLKV